MDVFEWINILQVVFIGFIFVVCFKDENLRYLAMLIMFVNVCWYPLLKVLTLYSPPGYGWVYIVAASIANYLTYELILLRYHYSEVLENRIKKGMRAFRLQNTWLYALIEYVFPKSYEIRRYAQEYPLAKSFKYISYFTMFILIQYPISWYVWHCDPTLAMSCEMQLTLHNADENGLAVFVNKLYFMAFGEYKYAIWDAYDEGYSAIALFQLYVLSRLGFHYCSDRFISKNKLKA